MSKITSIEKVSYRGWVYGFEVEEDESYVANGIVVHNCEEGVNPEAKFDIISKSLPVDSSTSHAIVETYNGLPIIRKHQAEDDHLHAPDFEDDTEKSTGDAYSEPNPEANAPLLGKSVNEADLLRYFGAFRSLFDMHHNTGGLEVVLYDPASGEILLEEAAEAPEWINDAQEG